MPDDVASTPDRSLLTIWIHTWICEVNLWMPNPT